MTRRYDYFDLPQMEDLIKPFTEDKDKHLSGTAVVTTAGVFTYRNYDGTIHRELRLPEDVFSDATLDSMKRVPLTLEHPLFGWVDDDNLAEVMVGALGDDPAKKSDGMNCTCSMTITREDAVNAVKQGVRGLSMGYSCDLEEAKPGARWCGMEYDYIQRNIKYNHCAIVSEPRAGDTAKIVLRGDSADAIVTDFPNTKGNKTGGEKPMKKINIDGIEYEGEDRLVEAYAALSKKADALDKELAASAKAHSDELSKLRAERDSAVERADKADAERKEMETKILSKENLDSLLNAKIALLDNAKAAGVEVKSDAADAEIKKAIILKYFPAAKLDGADDAYLNARYDCAVEMIEKAKDEGKKADAADAKTVQATAGNVNTDSGDSAEKHRVAMIDALKKASRGE